MKRRNFLKLFPFAGLAAVFGVKLRAELVPKMRTGIKPIMIDEMDFYSGPLGIPWDNSAADPLQDLAIAYDEIAKTARVTYV